MPFFEYVDRCTLPSDRLIVTSLFPDVLVLAHRGFAAGNIAMTTGYSSRTAQEQTVARLQSDAAPLALTNALIHRADLDRDAHVLLDIGHTASHLTLYQRGEPYFSRRLEFGGRHLTEAIMKGTSVPFAEAEEFKLAAGSEQPGFLVDWNLPEMQAMSDSMRDRLVDDVLRSLAFYRTLGRLPEQLSMWISGGSARLPGLAGRLTELLGFPVLLFNPLDYLTGDPRSGSRPNVAPQFAQAFGLSLRTA